MEPLTIALLTIALALILAIMVIAGLVLSGRAFTQLLELTRFVGSLVGQLTVGTPQAPTTSSQEQDKSTSLLDQNGTPTTPESASTTVTDSIETTK